MSGRWRTSNLSEAQQLTGNDDDLRTATEELAPLLPPESVIVVRDGDQGCAVGRQWTEACDFANAAAAITVTRRGPATSPTRKEVQQFLSIDQPRSSARGR